MKGKACRCRLARRHRDCAYCGSGWADGAVCGACREEGIDGKVIPGTAAVTCGVHKAQVRKIQGAVQS